jgi:hypothetical protein
VRLVDDCVCHIGGAWEWASKQVERGGSGGDGSVDGSAWKVSGGRELDGSRLHTNT